MKTANLISVLCVVGLLPLLVACAPDSKAAGGYPADYLAAIGRQADPPKPLDPQTLSYQQAQVLTTFKRVFSHLQATDLAARIRQSYAKNIYFNDAFKTLHRRDALIHYLSSTASKAKVKMIFLGIAGSGPNYFVNWYMTISYPMMGKTISRGSIGVSQLRINAAGKIVLQQDFWDGVEGFYQDIPIMGYWLKKIRGGM